MPGEKSHKKHHNRFKIHSEQHVRFTTADVWGEISRRSPVNGEETCSNMSHRSFKLHCWGQIQRGKDRKHLQQSSCVLLQNAHKHIHHSADRGGWFRHHIPVRRVWPVRQQREVLLFSGVAPATVSGESRMFSWRHTEKEANLSSCYSKWSTYDSSGWKTSKRPCLHTRTHTHTHTHEVQWYLLCTSSHSVRVPLWICLQCFALDKRSEFM